MEPERLSLLLIGTAIGAFAGTVLLAMNVSDAGLAFNGLVLAVGGIVSMSIFVAGVAVRALRRRGRSAA